MVKQIALVTAQRKTLGAHQVTVQSISHILDTTDTQVREIPYAPVKPVPATPSCVLEIGNIAVVAASLRLMLDACSV